MLIRNCTIRRDDAKFWTGYDWADPASAALWMTLAEAIDAIERLAHGSPYTLHIIKDYYTAAECVLCTA